MQHITAGRGETVVGEWGETGGETNGTQEALGKKNKKCGQQRDLSLTLQPHPIVSQSSFGKTESGGRKCHSTRTGHRSRNSSVRITHSVIHCQKPRQI